MAGDRIGSGVQSAAAVASSSISEPKPEYLLNAPEWTLIKTCLAGERAVKATGEKLLPYPVPVEDDIRKTEEFAREYRIYNERAVFVNYTRQAVEDLVAGVFRRPPIVTDLPEALEYLDLTQLSRKLVSELTAYGRAFGIVDYPQTERRPSLAEERERNLRLYHDL
jgi:hypothetical protein